MAKLSDDEKKIADRFGMTHAEFAERKEATFGKGPATDSLSADDRKVATAFGIPPGTFGRLTARQRRAVASSTYGFSKDELAVARAFGMSARTMCAAKGERRPEKPGLVAAHTEIDGAHKIAYEENKKYTAGDLADQELIDMAVRELQAFDLKDEDGTYDRLLNGALYAMRMLNRIAPSFADQD
jgi:hypothetical protein